MILCRVGLTLCFKLSGKGRENFCKKLENFSDQTKKSVFLQPKKIRGIYARDGQSIKHNYKLN
jgi:hypothetical protein